MKILWFTNNAVNLNSGILAGGWMQALEKLISKEKDIKLYIATRTKSKTLIETKINDTTYLAIPDSRNIIKKRFDVFINHEPHNYFLEQYLLVIKRVKPDVIQVFGSEMDFGLICSQTNIPTIIHTQGILHPLYLQVLKNEPSFLQKIKANSLSDFIIGRTISNGIKTFKRRLKIEKKILNSCQYVLGRTDWDKKTLSIIAPNAKYFHCDEMLRNEFFESSWEFSKCGTIHIVSTISNALYKGHDNIVNTCFTLKEADIKFKWHIIGINHQSIAYKLFYKQYKRELSGLIHFHGNIPPNQMISIMQNACMYVHPSHIENSSNALCEAMALGMPVIALDVGGNTSIVQHQEDGLVCPDNDPYVLTGTIKYLSDNTDLMLNFSKNAKKRALSRHNPDKIVSDLMFLYNDLTSNHEN